VLVVGVFVTPGCLAAWWAVFLVEHGALSDPEMSGLGYAMVITSAAASVSCLATALLRLTGQLRPWMACASIALFLLPTAGVVFGWPLAFLVALIIALIVEHWPLALGYVALIVGGMVALSALDRWPARRQDSQREPPDR
jgi:hypothetical protein